MEHKPIRQDVLEDRVLSILYGQRDGFLGDYVTTLQEILALGVAFEIDLALELYHVDPEDTLQALLDYIHVRISSKLHANYLGIVKLRADEAAVEDARVRAIHSAAIAQQENSESDSVA